MSIADSPPSLTDARAAYRRGSYESATRLYAEAAAQDRLDSLSRLRFGSCRLLAGDLEGAAREFESALREKPNDPALLTHLAVALEMGGRQAEAAALYRQVISATPHAGTAFANLAYLMATHGNLAGAEECLQAGLGAVPTSLLPDFILPTFDIRALPSPSPGRGDPLAAQVLLLLGLRLQELSRFEAAEACFVRAVRFNPWYGSGYGSLVNVRRITENDRPMIRQMEALSTRKELDDPSRTSLLFALGKAMDDLGDYERAIGYFDRAHVIAREKPGPRFDVDAIVRQGDNLIATYTQSEVRKGGVSGSDSSRPILIVGMMRSGTTLVEQILSSHPEVGAGDELPFWLETYRQVSAGTRTPTEEEAKGIAAAYLDLIKIIDPDGARVTDKMPHNFMGVGLMHRVFPNARIICCRRNPVDTCLSLYMTNFRHPMPFLHARENLAATYREFERVISHWRAVMPADRFMEVRYEDLLSDRESTTRRLVDFCGIEWDEACLRPEANRRPVKTASVWQVRQSVYGNRERWRRYQPWLGALSELLSSE